MKERQRIEAALAKHRAWVARYEQELSELVVEDPTEVTVHNGHPGRSSTIPDRWYEMLNLRCQGATLETIGAQFYISRERVRQCLSALRQRNAEADGRLREAGFDKPYAKCLSRRAKPKTIKPRTFGLRVQNWLIAQGYQWCWKCRGVKEQNQWMPKMRGKRGLICRECNTRRCVENWRNNPEARSRRKEYYRTERGREVQKAATDRYWSKPGNRERLREIYRIRSKQKYDALRSTPEGRERLRAQWKAANERRKQKRIPKGTGSGN